MTHDAAWWSLHSAKADDLPIYSSELGGDGDAANSYCVSTAPWSVDEYTVSSLCADTELLPDCCLKRFHVENEQSFLSTRAQFGDVVFTGYCIASFYFLLLFWSFCTLKSIGSVFRLKIC